MWDGLRQATNSFCKIDSTKVHCCLALFELSKVPNELENTNELAKYKWIRCICEMHTGIHLGSLKNLGE